MLQELKTRIVVVVVEIATRAKIAKNQVSLWEKYKEKSNLFETVILSKVV